MEEQLNEIEDSNTDYEFFDALDEFPFFDCTSDVTLDEESVSDVSQLEPIKERTLVTEVDDSSEELNGRSTVSIGESNELNLNLNSNSNSTVSSFGLQRRNKILNALKEKSSTEAKRKNQESTSTNSAANAESHLEEHGNSSSFLVFLAGLVIKAIGFQVNLLVSFISFPFWFSYFSFMLMVDPYRTLKRSTDAILKRFHRVWNVLSDSFGPYLVEKLKGQKSIARLALRFGWGFVCSVYICFVLFGFLVSGFIIGGFTIRYLVEEPIQITESLNFDYTRPSPVALVPVMSCPSYYSGVKYQDVVIKSSAIRVLPPNHKLQVIVSLTMPESYYNQKLGVFQVRVDLLSEHGEVTASSRLPCMLRYKSHLIRYLETFLKSVPLLAGYASETQILNIKMRGFTEGYKPTSCIRVILEQRAEYRSGAGIPEIYGASLLLQSQHPLFKRLVWYWKKTIFVWISLVSFTMELMLALLCCRPMLIPRARPRDTSAASNAPQRIVAPVVNSPETRVSRAQS